MKEYEIYRGTAFEPFAKPEHAKHAMKEDDLLRLARAVLEVKEQYPTIFQRLMRLFK